MILPTKHISTQQALIGTGALILQELSRPISVSKLWENVRSQSAVDTYERFVLTLDMLYIIGIITIEKNKIRRAEK